MDKDSARGKPKYTVERKTNPERKKHKKKVTFSEPAEPPESKPSKLTTNTQDNNPGRKIKRKRQEDKEEVEIMKPKKTKTLLKESSTNMAQQDQTSSDDGQKKQVERKINPKKMKQKKKVTFSEPTEPPESEPSKPSTSTPVRNLKRKRQEDKEEVEMIKPKKMKTPLKDSSSNEPQQSGTTSNDEETQKVERKPSPRKKKEKKKHIVPKPTESPESEPSQLSTSTQDNTPVTTLKRKRQEDKEEEEIIEPKKMKTPPKDSSCSEAEQIIRDDSEINKTDTIIDQTDEFEAKYVEENQFSEGGFGSIYAGFRKSDNLPVAIKHILKRFIKNKQLDDNGKIVPSEVAIMLMLQEESCHSEGKAAPVFLLDWYEIGGEVVLVMERPIPCEDLFDYIENKGGKLEEKEAKIIMKQLIRTAIDLEDRNIFHQDIKTDNILIQTHSNTPQARLIDFGVSCMAEKDSMFIVFSGIPAHAPPEFFRGLCSPGPTTVWQLGVVLYETLHYCNKFSTKDFIQGSLMVHNRLSEECQDFFQACLNTSMEQRAQLQDLLHHPWLR